MPLYGLAANPPNSFDRTNKVGPAIAPQFQAGDMELDKASERNIAIVAVPVSAALVILTASELLGPHVVWREGVIAGREKSALRNLSSAATPNARRG